MTTLRAKDGQHLKRIHLENFKPVTSLSFYPKLMGTRNQFLLLTKSLSQTYDLYDLEKDILIRSFVHTGTSTVINWSDMWVDCGDSLLFGQVTWLWDGSQVGLFAMDISGQPKSTPWPFLGKTLFWRHLKSLETKMDTVEDISVVLCATLEAGSWDIEPGICGEKGVFMRNNNSGKYFWCKIEENWKPEEAVQGKDNSKISFLQRLGSNFKKIKS